MTRFDRATLLRQAAAATVAPDSFLRPHPRWRFVFVNHATSNPFFVPALYGMADAADLYGVRYAWSGSKRSDVGEMVRAMNHAIDDGADGIAVSVIDPHAFAEPAGRARRKGIPVIAYNADGGVGTQRLAYVGQDLYQAGLTFGARIAELVDEGDVFVFIATPGQLNIQPRFDGARDAIRDSGKPIRVHQVASGADVREERQRIADVYRRNPTLRGMFAVDGGSTQGVAEVMRANGLHRKGVRAGGFDLLPGTLGAIAAGHLDFTIDQQPYLQGFVPIQQLFLYRYSGSLVSPADTNTGSKLVTGDNVKRYLTTRTRYEGSSSIREFPVA